MKLTIVTICRNDAEGLEQTLRSTLLGQQGFDDWEQIVVDGASTDRTPEVLAQFRHEPRLAKVVSEPDEGVYDAMDKGAALARGDWLLFLNSGDTLVDGVLDKVFAEARDADVMYGDLHDGMGPDARIRVFPEGESISPVYFLADYLPHPASFISRAFFERFGGYDRTFRIVGDADFFLRAASAPGTRFLHLPFPVSRFLGGGLSSSMARWPKMRAELNAMFKSHFPPRLRQTVLDGRYCRRIGATPSPEAWLGPIVGPGGCMRRPLIAAVSKDAVLRHRLRRFLDLFAALSRSRFGNGFLGLIAFFADRLEAWRLRRGAGGKQRDRAAGSAASSDASHSGRSEMEKGK